MVSDGTRTLVWDAQNKLASVTPVGGGQAVTFLFGPDGSRIAKLSSFTPLSVCFAIACPAQRRINGLGEMGQQPFYERVNLQGGNGVARL
ncbi:MAG: hypothetical protein AAFR39_05550 [Pseudomonadota bacterium]